jgi:hypothetical protein
VGDSNAGKETLVAHVQKTGVLSWLKANVTCAKYNNWIMLLEMLGTKSIFSSSSQHNPERSSRH